MATTKETLNVIVKYDTKGAIQSVTRLNGAMDKFQVSVAKSSESTGVFAQNALRSSNSVKKMGGSVKNSGAAFTQLAYALDDAQYGFRGVQNNIQAIAVSAGLGGPLILAITAATVALGFFIDKWQEGSKEAKSTIDTMIQEIKELRGELGIDTKDDPVTKLISNHRKAIAAAKKELEALKKEETVTTTTGYNTFRTTRTVGTEEEIRKAAEKVRFLEKQLQQDVTRIHQQESAKRNKQTIQGWEKTYKELQAKIAKEKKTLTPDEKAANFELADELSEAEEMLSFALSEMKELNLEADKLAKIFKADVTSAVKQATDAISNKDNPEESLAGQFDLGNAALIGFLSTLNSASSGGFDNFAKGLIDTARNIAFAMAIAAATKDSVKFGAVALPALIGVALGVVGSAFRSNVKGGGGGRSTSASIAATSFSATPISQQGRGGSGQLVATVRGQDLRFALQNANAINGQTT